MRKQATGGRYSGRAPYGWRAVNGRLEAVSEEQDAHSLMVSMLEDGASLPVTCEALSEAGNTTKSGGRWHTTTVSKIWPGSNEQGLRRPTGCVLNRWLAVTPCVEMTLPKVDGGASY